MRGFTVSYKNGNICIHRYIIKQKITKYRQSRRVYNTVFLTWVVSEGVEETERVEGFIVGLATVQRLEYLTQV